MGGPGLGHSGEAGFFDSQTGPNGIDLAGFTITRVGFRLDSFVLNTSTNLYTVSGAWLFEGTPQSPELCKDEGWQTLERSDGTGFKNQGDCIQYFTVRK
jgi:hypothetical protein